MSNILRWIHLSDLHMRKEALDDLRPVLVALWKDIPQQIERLGGRLDFIAFTGDVAYSGKVEEYALAAQHFFKPLLSISGVRSSRLFMVPGNHDVDWDWLELIDTSRIAALSEANQVTALLENEQLSRSVYFPMEGYSGFVRRLRLSKGQLSGSLLGAYGHIIRLDDLTVAVLGFNSAWASGYSRASNETVQDRGNLLVGEKLVADVMQQTANADFRIILMHHPISWLRDFEVGRVQAWLSSGPAIVLQGHLHARGLDIDRIRTARPITISAGRVSRDSPFLNGYNLMQLDLDSGVCEVAFREFERSTAKFSASEQTTSDSGRMTVRLGLLASARDGAVRKQIDSVLSWTEVRPSWWLMGRKVHLAHVHDFLSDKSKDILWVWGELDCGTSEFLQATWELLRAQDVEVVYFDGEDRAAGIPVDQWYFLDGLDRWLGVSSQDTEHGDVEGRVNRISENMRERLSRQEGQLVLMFANYHAVASLVKTWVEAMLWPRLVGVVGGFRVKCFFASEGPNPPDQISSQVSSIYLDGLSKQDVRNVLSVVGTLTEEEKDQTVNTLFGAGSERFRVPAVRVYQNLRTWLAGRGAADDL